MIDVEKALNFLDQRDPRLNPLPTTMPIEQQLGIVQRRRANIQILIDLLEPATFLYKRTRLLFDLSTAEIKRLESALPSSQENPSGQ